MIIAFTIMNYLYPLLIIFLCLSICGSMLLIFSTRIAVFVNRLALMVFRFPIFVYPDIKKAVDVVFGEVIMKVFFYFCSLIFILVGLSGVIFTAVKLLLTP